jgi:predicted phosphodiesterase
MKIGLLSDIHSNLEALAVILQNLEHEKVNQLYCCGDIVGYGPNPNECIELLKQHRALCVQGNHDAAAIRRADLARFNKAGRLAIQWTWKQLSLDSKAFLEQLPTVRQVEIEGICASLIHGSPIDPLWGYMFRRRDVYLSFRLTENKPHMQLFGHTHVPALFAIQQNDVRRQSAQGERRLPLEEETRYYLNPGSVGQPRDGNWRAGFCVLELEDTQSLRVQFRRVEYEVEKTRQKIMRAGLPKELGIRLLSGI